MNIKRIIFIFFLSFFCLHFIAQEKTLQSLQANLVVSKNDSIKADLLSELIEIAPEGKWEKYNLQLKEISEKNIIDCKAKTICDYYKKHYATCLVNLGYSYMNQGISDKALGFYLRGLKIYEELNNLEGIAETNNNIGFVFQQQKNFEKAQQFYEKSLRMFEAANNKEGVATGFNNLGYTLKNRHKFNDALISYNKAFSIYDEIKDSLGIATTLNNIGRIYLILKDTVSAIENYKKSIIIFERKSDEDGYVYALQSLGKLYYYTNNLEAALLSANKSFSLTQKLGFPESIRDAAKLRFDILKKKNESAEALKMYELYVEMRDSVLSEKSQVSIIEQQSQYNHEKEVLKLEKQQVLSLAEKQKRNLIIYSIILILVIVCVFSFSLFKKFKLTSKQKNLIEVQRNEVESQKHIIELKQKDIQDSINYAKRIQSSFMASKSVFEKKCSDSFVFFNPKDIVSGDFYWANWDFDKLYLCVADSTGHGIPGAFMSLLNISLLNEALLSRRLVDTSDILNFVRKILILGLKPDESGQGGNDGMDCCFVRIDFNKMELQISGANNPLWIIRDDALIELPCDRMPVGRSPKQDLTFTHQTFLIKKGDILYLFTDGFADQFGGPNLPSRQAGGKKFKYKPFQELLISNSNKSLQMQKEALSQSLNTWKGDLEQVDDICIVGIKI